MWKLKSIVRSEDPTKKFVATFIDDVTNRTKRTKFGAAHMDDYTLTHDEEQRERYWKRHSKDLRTGDPTRAGYLSLYILWGPTTSIKENAAKYKKMFNL